MRNIRSLADWRCRGSGAGRPAIGPGAGFPDPAGPYRRRVSARRPHRFRRPPGRRQDDGAARPARLYRQQARRQRHAGRRRRRQIRSRRLLAVPHHRRRGDGVAAYHGEHAVRHASAISRRSRWSPKSPRCWSSRRRLGIKNVKDLVALAKAKAGHHSFASTGIGSPPHLAQDIARCLRGRAIPARAVSRRGAGADRSARRPGGSGRRSTCRC